MIDRRPGVTAALSAAVSAALSAAVALLGIATICPRDAAAQAERAGSTYDRLTPRQRVGQLFLVAVYVPQAHLEGPDADPLVDVRRLVQEYGLGGVVLQKSGNWFQNTRGTDLPADIATLTGRLQTLALDAPGPGVPLFIAVDHEGDGDPLTHLREGFTALPSAMAIGATYDPANAETVGRIVGSELAAVGVNLLLGPVLDVLADPRVDSGGDIGTRAFGGDPYWVRQMGAAYVRGVHAGGAGRVATVAKHFPGHGGSDRSTDDEVATVNRPIETLRDIELQPFAGVTSGEPGDPDAPGVTDALMTSHIRYRAIHPDVRRVTPPISFDKSGLDSLFDMPGFSFRQWSDGGGLVVADSLGVRAVRRWFDPAEATFPNRQIARQALLAGNDLLILAQFAVQPSWSSMLANVEDTLQYFAGQYQSDAAFRARVDAAGLKVLERKAALYPDWSPGAVSADPQRTAQVVGTDASREAVDDIARAAVTSVRALDRPRGGDRVVVVADFDRITTPGKLACAGESCGLSAERWARLDRSGQTLVDAFLRERFGPDGSGALGPDAVHLVTFCQLRELLDPRPPTPTPPPDATASPGSGPSSPAPPACDPDASPEAVRERLTAADWVVFAFADLSPTDVRDLRGLLLPQVSAFVQPGNRTRIAVLSFGPPYYVDQTNFYQIDHFIAAYSKIPASVEAAVAALFGEGDAPGALPVTYEDADRDLAVQLAPDPDQQLDLRLVSPDDLAAANLPVHVVVELGPVVDRNGNPVPDGTTFAIASDPPDALRGDPPEARTVAGTARVEVVLSTGGRVSLHATSETVSSAPLVLDLPLPTPVPTATPQPAPAPVPADAAASRAADRLGLSDLLVCLVVTIGLSALALSWRRAPGQPPDAGARAALLVAAGALSGYVALGVWLRFGPWDAVRRPIADVVAATLVGAGMAAIAGGLVAAARRARSLKGPATPPAPQSPG